MAITLTSGDTFDGIDVTIKHGNNLVSNSQVTSAVARIKKTDGTIQTRTMTVGPEDARFRYRMVDGDYTHFPGPKNYSYQVLLTFTDGTKKKVPNHEPRTMAVRGQL